MPTIPSARRIVVVGTSGSGKSTTAARLANALAVPHVELDRLYWQENWTGAPDEIFRDRVAAAIASDAWVVDGNYTRVQDMILARAELVVWLDLPLPVVLYRVVKRTLVRAFTRQVLWSGNRERLLGLLTRDSIVLWSLQTHGRNRRKYDALLAERANAGLPSVRLSGVRALDRFLDGL
jgi:adenylate kinase family enzyme